MPGRLAAFVYLNDERGTLRAFGPDDEIPDWAAAKITNPKAWARRPDAEGEAAQQTEQQTGPQPAAVPGDGRPPKNGSREIWAAYAVLRGIELDPDAPRDQIIAAVEAADQ